MCPKFGGVLIMAYRPRYLDAKRNKPKETKPTLKSTRIEQDKIIFDYSNDWQVICTKKIIECYDSEEKLKWWFGADGKGEIF